jgi:adenylate cyclase
VSKLTSFSEFRLKFRLSDRLAKVVAVVGSAALVAAAVLGFRAVGFLERMELAAYDHYVRLTAEVPDLGHRVAIVKVTEEDIQALGQWPMSDGLLAQVIETLQGFGARAIGFDIYRDLPVAPGSEQFDELLLASPRVVFPSKFSDGRSRGVGPPRVLKGTGRAGFNNFVVDVDGLVRRGLLFMDDDEGGVGYSFALLLALYYLADEDIGATPDPDDEALMRLGPTTFPRLDANSGSYIGADAAGYQYLADFRRAPVDFPSVNLIELLSGSDELSNIFYGRIAILGVTADSIPDVFYVPFERHGTTEIAGVFLHAQLASQMLRYAFGEGSAVHVLSDATEGLAIVVCALIGALLGLWSSSAWRFGLAGAIAVPGLWGLGVFAMQQGWWLPIVPAGAAWVLSGAVVTAYLAGRVRAERTELMQLFSRHVSTEVAEDVWNRRDEFMAGGRPQPTRLTATVLFVDMKGYTGKADSLDPADLMLWLNDYLDLLSQNILSGGGLIDDYFGDGIMAAFGLPVPRSSEEQIRADAVAAVTCALSMEASVRRVNEEWGPKGYPTVGIRVGLCTGAMVAGTIGSADRLKYSIVGDVVVTAQRLESLDDSEHDFAKEPIRILISEQTRSYIGHAFDTREQGESLLKGRAEPVMVYRVMGSLGDPKEKR